MVKCVSEYTQGPVSSAKMAEAGENISVVVSLIMSRMFPDIVIYLGVHLLRGYTNRCV